MVKNRNSHEISTNVCKINLILFLIRVRVHGQSDSPYHALKYTNYLC